MASTSKEFIKDPNKWPLWPFLPVKKSPDICGVIAETESSKWFTIVFVGYNVFKGGKLGDYPVKEYDTVEALLADGWQID